MILALAHKWVYHAHMNETQRYRATALSDVLRDQGRNQKWLAGRIGVTEAKMSRVVNGLSWLDGERAQRVAMILGVPLSLLFERTNASELHPSERIAS